MNSHDTILSKVKRLKRNSILFVDDFVGTYNEKEVSRALNVLTTEGKLARIGRGVFLKPEFTQFGIVYPSIPVIAKAIAQRDKVHILPTGATALNLLGLSTQVPFRTVYLTTGSQRELRINNHTILFRRSVESSFRCKTELMGLLIQALKELGEKNIEEKHLNQIAYLLSQSGESKERLSTDLKNAPRWIQHQVQPIINSLV